jgi:hypothetical protein
MKRTIGAVSALALGAGLVWAAARAQEGFPMPKPSKEHEFLKQFEGSWESTAKFRMSADQPWSESKGTETNRMMGGFWLVSEWKGDMMGQTFQGIGATGYDPNKKKYVGSWVDSMAPYLSTGEGTLDAGGKVLTTQVASTDFMTGKPCTMRMVQEIKDKDTTSWSMYMTGKDGKEFLCMSGESKRKK